MILPVMGRDLICMMTEFCPARNGFSARLSHGNGTGAEWVLMLDSVSPEPGQYSGFQRAAANLIPVFQFP